MINDCGCNSTRHQREVIFFFSYFYFSFFFLRLTVAKRERDQTEWTGICSSWLVSLLIGFPFYYQGIKAT